jgi:hypothetical protein
MAGQQEGGGVLPADGSQPAADPFDSDSFDVQHYVNSMFPSGACPELQD